MTGPVRYKLTLSPPDDTDPPTNPVWTVDNMLPVSPPAALAPQQITVWDFLSAEQIADVKARTNTLDCTAGIQEAIDYVAGYAGSRPLGILYFPAGSYRVEATLNVTAPIMLQGAGKGSQVYPATQPGTVLTWFGGAETMLIFGANGDLPFAGGGIAGMAFNGRQIATECLRVADAIRFTFSDIAPENATERVVALVNTWDVTYPTGFGTFENMWVSTGITGSNIANALWCGSNKIPHPNLGVDGVTFITFIGCHFQSDQGTSVLIVDRGDNFTWLHCSTGDQSAGGTVGTWFSGDVDTAVINTHTWINHTGSFRFDKGLGIGQRIINLNCFDLSDPSFADPRNMIFGEGATEVTVDTNIGWMGGQNKTLGWRQSIRHDAMQFMRWDGGNSLLHTAQGVWKSALVGSGTITDGAQSGGAVLLTTDTAGDDQTAIFNTATVGSGGLNPFYYPNVVFSIAPNETTDVIIRCGWMDALTDPPTRGIYVEVDTSQAWAGWRFVCIDGTGQSEIDSNYPFDVANTAYMFRIELSNNPQPTANFYARDYAFQVWDKATFDTHVPTVSDDMSFVFQIITKGAAAKSMYVNDFKLGFDTEETTS